MVEEGWQVLEDRKSIRLEEIELGQSQLRLELIVLQTLLRLQK